MLKKPRLMTQPAFELFPNDVGLKVRPDPFENLPAELLSYILSFVPIEERISMKTVCKRWHGIINTIPVRSLDLVVYPKSRIAIINKLLGHVFNNAPLTIRSFFFEIIGYDPPYRMDNVHLAPKYLKNLRFVDVTDNLAGDQFAKLLAVNCKHLAEVRLRYFGCLTDEGVRQLLMNCPIKKLTLTDGEDCTDLKGTFLENTGEGVQYLSLVDCPDLVLSNLRNLKRYKSIRGLNVSWSYSNNHVTNCLDFLNDLPPSLEYLALGYRFAQKLPNFSGFPRLKELYVSGHEEIGDAQVIMFARLLPNLEVLNLDSTGISDAGCVPLQEFRSLKYLSVRSARVTDVGLERISKIKGLSALLVSDTLIGNEGCRYVLENCENLEVFDITDLEEVTKDFLSVRRQHLCIYGDLSCEHLTNFDLVEYINGCERCKYLCTNRGMKLSQYFSDFYMAAFNLNGSLEWQDLPFIF